MFRGPLRRIAGPVAALVLVGAFGVSCPASAAPINESQVEDYLQTFFEMALWSGNETSSGAVAPGSSAIRKFVEPIRVRFADEHLRALALPRVREVALIQKLEVIEVSPQD